MTPWQFLSVKVWQNRVHPSYGPYIMSHFNANELLYAFVFQNFDFDNYARYLNNHWDHRVLHNKHISSLVCKVQDISFLSWKKHYHLIPPADSLFVDGFWYYFFSHYSSSCLDSKTYSIFFYDHYDVRYGQFFTSGVLKNLVFSSFWLTAFLLDFCPTLFWSKIDARDNSHLNYISTCL